MTGAEWYFREREADPEYAAALAVAQEHVTCDAVDCDDDIYCPSCGHLLWVSI